MHFKKHNAKYLACIILSLMQSNRNLFLRSKQFIFHKFKEQGSAAVNSMRLTSISIATSKQFALSHAVIPTSESKENTSNIGSPTIALKARSINYLAQAVSVNKPRPCSCKSIPYSLED